VPVSVPDANDDAAPSSSLDDVVFSHASRIPFSLRGSVEIL
jgi:hypothetical protein